MKKNKLLIFVVFLACLSILFYSKDNLINSSNKNNVATNIEEKKETMHIYMYNIKNSNYDIYQITKNDIIDEGNYIEEIIKLSNFSNNKYKFLAVYNINRNSKNTLIVKISSEFSKLNNSSMSSFVNSVKRTLKENFNELEDIIVEIDAN